MKNSFLYFLSKYLNTHLPLTVGASSNTIKAYSDTFKLFFLFAKEKYNLNPKKIEFETIDKKFVMSSLLGFQKHENHQKVQKT